MNNSENTIKATLHHVAPFLVCSRCFPLIQKKIDVIPSRLCRVDRLLAARSFRVEKQVPGGGGMACTYRTPRTDGWTRTWLCKNCPTVIRHGRRNGGGLVDDIQQGLRDINTFEAFSLNTPIAVDPGLCLVSSFLGPGELTKGGRCGK